MFGLILVIAAFFAIHAAKCWYNGHIRSLFFKSQEYLESKTSLERLCAVMQSSLDQEEEIGQDLVDRLVEQSRPSAEFLMAVQFELPVDVSSLLEFRDGFADAAKSHDAEVSFRNNFFEPCRRMLSSARYIAYSECADIKEQGADGYRTLNRQNGWRTCYLTDTRAALSLYRNLEEEREDHNRRFVADELLSQESYFDGLERYRLDSQQRTACVVDDDATLVVAGAGSGKTSTILSKVRYLIEKRGVSPEQILLISFTKKSASDVSDRLSPYVGGARLASTFHKFGLDLLREYGDGSRDIVDNPDEFLKSYVHSSLGGEGVLVESGYQAIVRFFAYYFNPESFPKEGESMGAFIDRTKTMNFTTMRSLARMQDSNITLSGEKVKSMEEVLIANFLFLNGVEYEYEKPFPEDHLQPDGGCLRRYRPDFTLTEYDGLYLEHYAVDENGQPPDNWDVIERQKYVDGMEWKRKFHEGQGTRCLESFSWWCRQGVLLDNLRKILEKAGVVLRPRDSKDVWSSIYRNHTKQQTEFEKLICTFIGLFKSNGWTVDKFDELMANDPSSGRERRESFLSVVRGVYEGYEAELRSRGKIDFDDMINLATDLVKNGRVGNLPFRYVIVDEFQDISVGRMNLLRSVINNSGAHLFCVGDDWQSIYRFSGSDNSLFVDFDRYFPHSVQLKIENTYRNSQDLIDIMGRFVMRNPRQIRKRLQSQLSCPNPIVPILYEKTDAMGRRDALAASLDIIATLSHGETSVKVFLIGRTRFDSDNFLPPEVFDNDGLFSPTGRVWKTCRNHPTIKVRFLTAHSSKGLEADYVILLNAENDVLGFPNRIADDPLLQLVLTESEDYEFAEERRLLYVALTRTRKKSFVLAPANAQSPFVDELKELGAASPVLIGGVQTDSNGRAHCPKCQSGILLERNGPIGRFCGCSNYPRCDYSIRHLVGSQTPRCPHCGGFLVKRFSASRNSEFMGCSNFPICRYATHL